MTCIISTLPKVSVFLTDTPIRWDEKRSEKPTDAYTIHPYTVRTLPHQFSNLHSYGPGHPGFEGSSSPGSRLRTWSAYKISSTIWKSVVYFPVSPNTSNILASMVGLRNRPGSATTTFGCRTGDLHGLNVCKETRT